MRAWLHPSRYDVRFVLGVALACLVDYRNIPH